MFHAMKNERSVEEGLSCEDWENLSEELPERYIEYAENGDTGPLATVLAKMFENCSEERDLPEDQLIFVLDKMTEGDGVEFKAPRDSLEKIVKELVMQRRNAARPDPEESDEVEWYLREKKGWIPAEESRE